MRTFLDERGNVGDDVPWAHKPLKFYLWHNGYGWFRGIVAAE